MNNSVSIFVRNKVDLGKVKNIKRGIVYLNTVGGFANQLYSLVSSIILAEVNDLPFICMICFHFGLMCVDVDNTVETLFTIKRVNSSQPVVFIHNSCK